MAESDGPEPRVEPDVRFSLANERTLLAYLRTAIGLIGAAVAVAHFLEDADLALVLAGFLLLGGAVAAIGGYRRFQEADRAIREGAPLRGDLTAPLLLVMLLGALVFSVAYVVATTV